MVEGAGSAGVRLFSCLLLLTHAAAVQDSKLSPRGSDLSPADLLPSSPGRASKDLMFGQGSERNLSFLDALLRLI